MVWLLEEQEAETHDCGAADVVVHVGDGDMEQLPDSLVVPSPAVRHGDSVHTRP